jgi:hypothetical protein
VKNISNNHPIMRLPLFVMNTAGLTFWQNRVTGDIYMDMKEMITWRLSLN